MEEVKSGSKYEVMVQVIVIDSRVVHYQEVPSNEGCVPSEKTLPQEIFNKRYAKQGNVYIGYFRVDGIKGNQVYATPINRGGVPIDEEVKFLLEECQSIFHAIDQTPSFR